MGGGNSNNGNLIICGSIIPKNSISKRGSLSVIGLRNIFSIGPLSEVNSCVLKEGCLMLGSINPSVFITAFRIFLLAGSFSIPQRSESA